MVLEGNLLNILIGFKGNIISSSVANCWWNHLCNPILERRNIVQLLQEIMNGIRRKKIGLKRKLKSKMWQGSIKRDKFIQIIIFVHRFSWANFKVVPVWSWLTTLWRWTLPWVQELLLAVEIIGYQLSKIGMKGKGGETGIKMSS